MNFFSLIYLIYLILSWYTIFCAAVRWHQLNMVQVRYRAKKRSSKEIIFLPTKWKKWPSIFRNSGLKMSKEIVKKCKISWHPSLLGLRILITFMRIRNLTSIRIRIRFQLFTLLRMQIRILLLFKVTGICDHWLIDPIGPHFEPPGFHCERSLLFTALF